VARPDARGVWRWLRVARASAWTMLVLVLVMLPLATLTRHARLYLFSKNAAPVQLAFTLAPDRPVSQVAEWSQSALTRVLSFNFVDATAHFERVRPLFAPSGWASLSAAMTSSRLVKQVVRDKLQVTLVPTAMPRVVAVESIGSYRVWSLQFPILLVFQGPGSPRDRNLLAQVVVTSLPAAESPQGLGILQLNFIANPDEQ